MNYHNLLYIILLNSYIVCACEAYPRQYVNMYLYNIYIILYYITGKHIKFIMTLYYYLGAQNKLQSNIYCGTYDCRYSLVPVAGSTRAFLRSYLERALSSRLSVIIYSI